MCIFVIRSGSHVSGTCLRHLRHIRKPGTFISMMSTTYIAMVSPRAIHDNLSTEMFPNYVSMQ